MTMVPADIQKYGDELYEALATRRAIAPLTDRIDDISIEDAYRIQERMIQHRLDKGETIIGKKVGVTSKAVMDMLDVRQPDFGMLLSTMVCHHEWIEFNHDLPHIENTNTLLEPFYKRDFLFDQNVL